MRNLVFLSTVLASCALHAQPSKILEPCALDARFARGNKSLCAHTCAPTYSVPASVKLERDYSFFAGASYLYWYAGMEGLDLATPAAYNGTNTIVPAISQSNVVFQNAEYSSGFKINLGSNLPVDDWVLRADYTRFHNSTISHEIAPTSSVGTGAFYFTNWFYQISAQNQGIAATQLLSDWDLGVDLIDLTMQRPFYQGRMLTFTPNCGLRAAIISQSLTLQANGVLNVTPASEPLVSRNNSHAWGIGPRVGIDGHLLLGEGFHLGSTIGASVLFTQFNVTHSEDPASSTGYPVGFAMHHRNCVRPMAEATLGAGWGSYFDNNKYYLDLAASYDFNYMWGQNMMRTLNDLSIIGTNSATNDLFLHGLTLTASFNF